jgi:hypothetical protein
MKKKQFFTGIFGVLLIFGMMVIGCDNGTTTVTESIPVYPDAAPNIARSFGVLKALVAAEKSPIYIVEQVTVTEDLTIPDGVKVVIATESYAIRHPLAVVSEGYGELIVANGAALTVASGGTVVVGNTSETGQTSVLRIEAGGKFHVPSGATLAITAASQVFVETAVGVPTANTGLFIDDGAKLAIVGDLGTRDVIGTEEDESNSVIVVEGAAPVVIGAVQVYDNADTAISDEDGSNAITGDDNPIGVSVEAGKAAVAETSPAQGTATASEVAGLFTTGATTVTYTGTTALTEGNAQVPAGKALIITGNLTQTADLTVSSGGTLAIASGAEVTVDSGKKLTLTGSLVNNGTVTLVGTIEGEGAYSGGGTFNVSTTTALNNAVAFNVPAISLNSAFYTAANAGSGAVVIGAGETDRTVPVTIKGLGKTGTALTAGIWIANDNISLQDVKFNVTASTKATITNWNPGYTAAVSIGRSSDGSTLLTGADQPANNVTVSGCDISISGTSGFVAGIFINGGSAWSTTDVLYPSKNITISGNTIDATGNGGSAVQGLYIGLYDYSVKVTGNTITAKYGTAQSGKRMGAPASAIFINSIFGESGTGSPEISNNILNGNDATTERTAYSFYINAFQTRNPTVFTDHSGVDVLRGDNFALYETTWALNNSDDTDSSYKKVFNALLANITGTGFGSISIPYSASAYEFEHYNISNGKVTVISVIGDHLTDGKYVGTDDAANKFGASGSAPNGVDYGSFTVTNGVASGTKNGKFYFTYGTQDSDYIYNN